MARADRHATTIGGSFMVVGIYSSRGEREVRRAEDVLNLGYRDLGRYAVSRRDQRYPASRVKNTKMYRSKSQYAYQYFDASL
jgi:hypothetical protein